MTTYTVVDRDQLDASAGVLELQGYRAGAAVSVILVDLPPGGAVRLHRHAYQEVFVVQEGRATYRVGDEVLDVRAGQILVVSPGVAHAFANTGDGPLRQVDIHVSDRFVTEWLESA